MAKYGCPFCEGGYAHTSGLIPNPNEYLVTSAVQWDAMPEMLSPDDLYAQAAKMYRCVNCDAIAIFWRGFESDEMPQWYRPYS